ncbi:uncharacterized protein LOC121420775 isoform X1 [Lytechinus variegatus]|uniref:uncharacterized protein LOC121420775 isoform X1 n=1 Tax=Lytechinus variegatus TaxID=7654 RepID=UPI001BB127A1|nr:uncharacterized protein LOC121420775 isoform X1 [Lytechinus variegatus]
MASFQISSVLLLIVLLYSGFSKTDGLTITPSMLTGTTVTMLGSTEDAMTSSQSTESGSTREAIMTSHAETTPDVLETTEVAMTSSHQSTESELGTTEIETGAPTMTHSSEPGRTEKKLTTVPTQTPEKTEKVMTNVPPKGPTQSYVIDLSFAFGAVGVMIAIVLFFVFRGLLQDKKEEKEKGMITKIPLENVTSEEK